MMARVQAKLKLCSKLWILSNPVKPSCGLQGRGFRSSACSLGAFDQEFQEAQSRLKTLEEDPGNEVKLKMYSLFKQATIGKCNVPKPGMMDFVGKAKWDAWKKLETMTQDDAQKAYIDTVQDLLRTQGPSDTQQHETSEGTSEYKFITVEQRDKMNIITFNRPKKKNALNIDMYHEITNALNTTKDNKDAALTVVTGAGDYFCSGNDLSNFLDVDPSQLPQLAKEGAVLLEAYVSSFIDHPKPLIAVVNGPAFGVSVTLLGVFDAVYASDRATFSTPFVALGQSPEGCSSYTFPKIMGHAKASEMMLFGRTFTAQEAKDAGLVSQVIPHEAFAREVWKHIHDLASLPKQSLQLSKQLLREVDREKLHEAKDRECKLLEQRWQSQECAEAVMKFFQSKM